MLPRIGREITADAVFDQRLEFADHVFEIVHGETGVELDALLFLDFVDHHFERIMLFLRFGLEAHDHVAVHLDETAVGIPGETLVTGLFGQTGNRFIIESEVENGVHHARHGSARAGANRNQQRIGRIAELLAHFLFNKRHPLLDIGFDQLEDGVSTLLGIDRAGFGADGETGWDGDTQAAHFSQIGPLAAQCVFHVCGTVGLRRTKYVDQFVCHIGFQPRKK